MDFSFDESQHAVRDLAAQVLAPTRDREQRGRAQSDRGHIDRRAWRALSEAGLLGIALPEHYGGAAQGFVAATLVLEQIGRAAAPLPFYASAICGGLPIAEFGTPEQRQAVLPGVVTGELILSGAYTETGTALHAPRTRAVEQRGRWRLTGRKDFVAAGLEAGRLVVSARTEDGVGMFLLDTDAQGVDRTRLDVVTEIPEARVELEDAPVEPLAFGDEPLAWTLQRAVTGLCAIGVGVFEEALRLTAEYTASRRQFDQPIGSFQAVRQRAADAAIDTEAIRLTTRQAAWRIEHGLPAVAEVAIAKFWLAEGGQRVAAAAQHLHGGIGVDRSYPLHRYYSWATWLQLALGGAAHHLLHLGQTLADEEPAQAPSRPRH